MRTGAASGHRGYFHEAVYYRSDDELLAVVVPFLRGGVDAGEPTLVAFGDAHAALLKDAMSGAEGVSFLTGGDMYARPAGAIYAYRRLLSELVADGAQQIRIIGELAPSAFGRTWDWWARYESAINHAYDDFPLWSMCAYDIGVTPAQVLDDVARTHPRSATPGGEHVPSPTYIAPQAYLTERRAVADDPIQHRTPAVEFRNPLPADVRHAIVAADPCTLPSRTVEDFVMAASEAVTNAVRHGTPPVDVKLWVDTDRMVLTVRDGGQGPTDPFAGLLPRRRSTPGGLGLWLAHQMCSHVVFERGDDHFTIRLTASAE